MTTTATTDGTNIHVEYPLTRSLRRPTARTATTDQVSGVPYNVQGETGNGFFPIDD